jgi:hypothetical protein
MYGIGDRDQLIGGERMEDELSELVDQLVASSEGETMRTGIFYVRVKEDLKKAFQDFFPHMSDAYIDTAKLFDRGKRYPVLAVEKVTVFTKDGDETESARFLVPSENENFIWIQCELFGFAGMATDE